MSRKTKVIIIGGGAAGFFAGINMAESNPDLDIKILEKSGKVLQKVKVSGGGRCNVTHACFDPKELSTFYPRGQKELLGPFHRFMTGDTIAWFEHRGVLLKVEEDMRMFPESNNSQTIIDCFENSAKNAGVQILLHQNVQGIKIVNNGFLIETSRDNYMADKLLIATGGNSKAWDLISSMGHHIIPPVPSLFTFNIKDEILKDIPGISVPNALVSVLDQQFLSEGPLLITHWGISGPAVLKLSSLAALELARLNYSFSVSVNWLNDNYESVREVLQDQKKSSPKKNILIKSPFEEIPKRLWAKFVNSSKISAQMNWSDLSKIQLDTLATCLVNTEFSSHGKTTFKEEFVTAGGVDLKEVNFKKFESRICPNLFFAGEVLNIDALTGGFNFQNAWTGAFIAAESIALDA